MPVTDRAKSLIKLVITGFECESGADLFHAQQDVMRWLGASLGRRLSSAEKQQAVADSEDLALAEQSVASIKESKLQYHENLQGLSEDLHPFSLLNNQPQTEERLIDKLEKRVCYFEEIAQKQAIPDKNKAAKKLYNQIKPLATQNMLFREKYQRPRESSSEILRAHPLTHALSDSKLQHWLAWSEWMVQHFHRSSSAVEERNGCLSEMYHQGRGGVMKIIYFSNLSILR